MRVKGGSSSSEVTVEDLRLISASKILRRSKDSEAKCSIWEMTFIVGQATRVVRAQYQAEHIEGGRDITDIKGPYAGGGTAIVKRLTLVADGSRRVVKLPQTLALKSYHDYERLASAYLDQQEDEMGWIEQRGKEEDELGRNYYLRNSATLTIQDLLRLLGQQACFVRRVGGPHDARQKYGLISTYYGARDLCALVHEDHSAANPVLKTAKNKIWLALSRMIARLDFLQQVAGCCLDFKLENLMPILNESAELIDIQMIDLDNFVKHKKSVTYSRMSDFDIELFERSEKNDAALFGIDNRLLASVIADIFYAREECLPGAKSFRLRQKVGLGGRKYIIRELTDPATDTLECQLFAALRSSVSPRLAKIFLSVLGSVRTADWQAYANAFEQTYQCCLSRLGTGFASELREKMQKQTRQISTWKNTYFNMAGRLLDEEKCSGDRRPRAAGTCSSAAGSAVVREGITTFSARAQKALALDVECLEHPRSGAGYH
jgi:hypothetical protein